MKKTIHVIIVICSSLIYSCQTGGGNTDTYPLKGLWTLSIMEQQDTVTGQWNEWRNGMQGYILYDNSNNMALHLTTKGYQDTDLRFPNFTDSIPLEALKHLTGSYTYFARYKILPKDSIVEHVRISHSNPGEWHLTVQRKFRFSGDTLILEPVESRNAGLRLKWLKFNETGNN